MRLGQKGKLSPRFIRPFRILQRVGPIVYQLALPPSFQGIYEVFHFLNLHKYVHDPDKYEHELKHISCYEPFQIKNNITFIGEPICLKRRERKLRSTPIPYVKVLRKHHKVAEATWEPEQEMRKK